MKLTLAPTPIVTHIGDWHFRLWEGRTDTGLRCKALLAIHLPDNHELGLFLHELTDAVPTDDPRADVVSAFAIPYTETPTPPSAEGASLAEETDAR